MGVTIKAYVPMITITDQNLPNAMKLAQHVADMVGDWNTVGDVTAYVPIATAPPAVSPQGKGMFTWHLPELTGALAWAKLAGLSWVAVKVHDGTAQDASQALKDFVRAFHIAGIKVYGWGYCYLAYPQAEANAAVLQVSALQLDGYVIDAEGEAAAAGPDPAAQFSATLAAGIKKPIGLSSYRYPTLHVNLPWHELLSVCTFHCPQLYWLGNNDPAAPATQLDRSVHELSALALLPVVPIGFAAEWTPAASSGLQSGGATWKPTVAQLQSFIEGARQNQCPGYAWWVWEAVATHADWANAIASAAVG